MGYGALLETMGRVNDVLNAKSLLDWDARTMMPPGGSATRGKQLATLVVLAHDLILADETRRQLDRAESEVAALPLDSVERATVAQVREAIDYRSRIPARLLQERAELAAIGQDMWVKARETSDYALFAPILEKTVALSRQMADAIGYDEHPYDALVKRFEPGETASSLERLFARLKEVIVPLVRAIAQKEEPRTDFLFRTYPEDQQHRFALQMAERIGYDFRRGRLDKTVHPFEVSFTRNDVRITTRFNRNYVGASLFGALHEAGHGLYEQGVDDAYTRTVLATDLINLYAVGGVSFGAHESQSRLWENHVGRSRTFWKLHFSDAQAAYPEQLADVDAETFFRGITRCKPSLIRVEADELTYDLHILLRIEIEKQLIEGSLAVKDVPEAWNATIKSYLGVDVPDDTRGVLQDVHWGSGKIGTFCNYTIGNVMAGQLFAAAQQDEGVAQGLSAGEYKPLRLWMVEHVNRHGRRYARDELLRRATGRALDPEPYLAYLSAKYSELYDL